LQSQSEGIINKLNSLRKEIHELAPWGNFSPEMITKLREEDIHFRFFVSPTRKFEQKWKEQYTIKEINVHAGHVYFVVILRDGEDVNIPAEEVTLPKNSLASLQKKKPGSRSRWKQ
jgi:V/A-type H+/Na+-transporting ATPase subunit I